MPARFGAAENVRTLAVRNALAREANMSAREYADDLTATVRYALETTRAIAACPFHPEVIVRVGDDAAESHAFERAKRIVRSNGTTWKSEALTKEIGRQLGEAADRHCPQCTAPVDPRW